MIETPVYSSEDRTVSGEFSINVQNNNTYIHKGISVVLEGYISGNNINEPHSFWKREILIESDGVLKGKMNYPFCFENFQPSVETCKNAFGNIKYVIRATVNRGFLSSTAVDKQIAVRINLNQPIDKRVYGLFVACGGTTRIIYQQDSRDYDVNSCIIGKIRLNQNVPKLNSLSVSLIRKDEYTPFSCNRKKQREELVEFIDLSRKLDDINKNKRIILFHTNQNLTCLEEDSISFKIPLCQYKLQQTSEYKTPNILYSIQYFIKLKFQEESGNLWVKDVALNIWRD